MKTTLNIFEYFINSIFPPLILIIGEFGNILGVAILYNDDKLKNIGPIYIYKFLFLSDLTYLPQAIISYLSSGFFFDPTTLSSLSCKFYIYFSFSLDAISPWLLVYISVEKFISISFSAKRFILRKKFNQFLYFISLIIFSFLYYIVQPFCWDVINIGGLNETILSCTFVNYELQKISSLMDTIHRVVLPFLLMVIFSSLLIGSIFISRRRVSDSVNENKRLKRDVRFAISSFSMNLLFMVLNLPLSMVQLFPNYSNIAYLSTFYLFYFSYGVNFYVLFLTNSIFRKEVCRLFKKKSNNVTDWEGETSKLH